jgi:predicted dehydrogenase
MTNMALLGGAHIHAPGFINDVKKRSADITVKSVWDHDAARGQKRADELKATFVADYKDILADSSISAVAIYSETNLHHELVLPTVEAKKDLFVEKPLGFSTDDAYAMAAAIEKAGVKFQTGYFRRGSPDILYIKQLVDEGTFGKITRIRGSNCHNGALGGWFDTDMRWMADPKIAGCGAFGDLGTHLLDVMIWMMGDITSVTGTVNNGTGRYGDCDETGEALIKFKNGVIGTLAAAWDDVANPVSLLVSGTEAHAVVIDGKVYVTSKKMKGPDNKPLDGKTPIADLPAPKPAGIEAFLDAISGKDATLVTAKEAAYRSAVIQAIYEGAAHNNWETPKTA